MIRSRSTQSAASFWRRLGGIQPSGVGQPVQRGQHQIVADRLAHVEAEIEAVLGDVGDTGGDRVLVGGQRDRLALEPDLALVGPGHAEQRQGELGAAGAEQPGEPQHLAAMQGEADILVLAGSAEAADLEQRRGAGPWARAETVCSMVSPVISSPMRRASTSATGQVPTLRPSRITVTRSAISTTSSRR